MSIGFEICSQLSKVLETSEVSQFSSSVAFHPARVNECSSTFFLPNKVKKPLDPDPAKIAWVCSIKSISSAQSVSFSALLIHGKRFSYHWTESSYQSKDAIWE